MLDPDIVRSIWDEICTATYVVCDLTALNPNVTLELGIVHTLGRNVLISPRTSAPRATSGRWRKCAATTTHWKPDRVAPASTEPSAASSLLSPR